MTARTAPALDRSRQIRVITGRGIQRRGIAPWLLFTALAIFAFFSLIYSRTTLNDSAFQLEEIQTQTVDAQAEYQRLRLEVARLQSPKRILPLAEELGLVLPQQVRVVEAPGVGGSETGADERWAEVKSILTASP